MDWTFSAPSLKYVLRKIYPAHGNENTHISDYAGYKRFSGNFFSVQENFLRVTDLNYLIIDEIASDYTEKMKENNKKINKLENNLGLDPV